MTVTVKHSKTNAISDWTQAQLDEQIALGNFAEGTVLADIVLPSDWNNDHTLTGVGTMAEQDANSVAITGGSINGTTIGATTASTGTFTTLIGGANVANYGQLTGGATTKAVEFMALGTDSNISIALDSKGTGAIDLATGSSGVNISNGGTVTAVTRTAAGTGYTSVPTVNITAPTTAGGVQAVITIPSIILASPGLASGGTGYTVGNVLTLSGGTFTTAATITVTSVSAGVITGVSISNNGVYTAAPAIPASVTGGTGTGATFNASFGINSNFSIGTAGSGYIEQPTITFSGGGGSGAAAYATVGSGTTVKTLGSSISFNVPSSEVLRLSDGSSAACYLNLQSSSTTIQGFASSSGSNVGYQWVTKGVSNHSFATNNSVSNEQFRVSHTASAVNYVQVTGGATTAAPIISAQGSDTNITLGITPKGSGLINLNAQTRLGFNSTNYITIAGSATTVSPTISALGGDTNIDLALTPKGTGLVRFGTYTAGAPTATGYISIKAADGTTYKVLVST